MLIPMQVTWVVLDGVSDIIRKLILEAFLMKSRDSDIACSRCDPSRDGEPYDARASTKAATRRPIWTCRHQYVSYQYTHRLIRAMIHIFVPDFSVSYVLHTPSYGTSKRWPIKMRYGPRCKSRLQSYCVRSPVTGP
jgi:hypothetical protein